VARWLALLAVTLSAAPASADDAFVGRIAKRVRERLDALVAARAPKLVPPTPIAVKWRDAKLGDRELDAPLVALVGAELDGDRKSGELYAVTSRAVIALGFRNSRIVELGRVAFTGERAVPDSRDLVGTAVVEGNEVVAASSSWVNELRVSWNGKNLVARQGGPGFLVCPGERLQLVQGRNHFTNDLYNVKCRELVDKAGQKLEVRAELAITNKLTVTVKRCVPPAACTETGRFEYQKVGVAFDIADVDTDGTPEVILTEAFPAGYANDVARVITLGGDERRGLFRTKPLSSGIAAVTYVDSDDPDARQEMVLARRQVGSTRVDFKRVD
jgi:hypothetical protein